MTNPRRLLAIPVILAALAGCAATANAPTSVTRQAKAPVAVTQPLIGRLNPAVTQATIVETICRRGWAQSVRPSSAYTSRLKRQHLPKGARMADWELDHSMPIELGGAPKDPANLHIVPIVRAKADDKWENKLHASVCTGSMTLAAARVKMSEIKKGEDGS